MQHDSYYTGQLNNFVRENRQSVRIFFLTALLTKDMASRQHLHGRYVRCGEYSLRERKNKEVDDSSFRLYRYPGKECLYATRN
jgi:hypothetical protein